jgi:hypothetical protein
MYIYTPKFTLDPEEAAAKYLRSVGNTSHILAV